MIQKRLVILEAIRPSIPFQMKYQGKYILVLFLPFFLILCGCANQAAPEGGPKDTKPPRAVECDPPNFSTNFKENSIKIDFDEFIALKNQATEVTVSPPLKTIPDLRLRGKSLVIKLEDTLAANTTYSIDFGKSISDITENNAFAGFSYVFSTGPFIDSLSLRGTVINAFDLIPQKDVFALLYINNNDTLALDSLPLKVKPYYVTKTNEKGEFLFHNLRSSPMKLTALSDQNGNLIFDQASERVGFSDSLVHPAYIPKPKIDSSEIQKDSLNAATDTAAIKPPNSKHSKNITKASSDTTKKDSIELMSAIPNNHLLLFDNADSIQRIQKTLVVKKGLVLITFRFPTKEIAIKPLNCDTSRPWAFKEYSSHKDSLYLWLANSQMDSLILRVSQDTTLVDTLKIELLKKDDKSAAKKKDQGKVFLGVSNNASSAAFNQFAGNFLITFSYPLSSGKLSLVRLIQEKDTLKPKIYYIDSLRRSIVIETKWKEDRNYSVFAPDSAFIGINELANDTVRIRFKTKQARDFGNLILEIDMSKHPGNYLIQLLNERDAVLAEKKINSNGKVKFEYLNPGKFKVKAVFDRNHNGHWDTGNFRKNIQPEEVLFLQKVIEIRANWDVEEKWATSPAN